MRKPLIAFLLTVGAVAAVFASRQAQGTLAAGVPSYRAQGPANAPVLIVVFSDFQCPNCAKAEPVLMDLMSRHAGKVRFLFRHHPLRAHDWSRLAARAAESAGLQGKFWEYRDILFERQVDWAVQGRDPSALFTAYARELGLDMDRFAAGLSDAAWNALLSSDLEAGKSLGVDATPTFFINGERRVGAAQLSSDGERLVELGGG